MKTEPDRAGRYWMTMSDGSRIALYRQTVEDFGLFSGKELSDEELRDLLENASAVSAKTRAVRIVAAASVSKKDLQRRLIQKGEDPRHAADAVAWMEEMHLVDDAETARQVVSRCVSKGYGLQRAKQALYEKKIPKQYWEEALENYPDQYEYILAFLRSHVSPESDGREVKRATDALLRRGHSYTLIRRAMSSLNWDAEEFLEE